MIKYANETLKQRFKADGESALEALGTIIRWCVKNF
jgi:hypothetical protein